MGLACSISQAQKYYVILRSEVYRAGFLCVCIQMYLHTYMNEQAAASEEDDIKVPVFKA